VRTLHRILVRRGLVVPQPDKRPRSSYRRFEYSSPNACWQIDATEWPIEGGVRAWIMDIIDDHSRLVPAAVVGDGPSGPLAWSAIEHAASTWGLPAMVLSDNGACFSARNRGQSHFQENLAALGVRTITSRPYHPQTCGKIERFHQTLKRWLRTQPLAADHLELEAQLEVFLDFYNHHRPHRALNGATPAQRWAQHPPATPGEPLEAPLKVHIGSTRVDRSGTVQIGRRYSTSVGTEHAGRHLTIIRYGTRVAILDGTRLLTRLTIDPTRRYQPSGRKRGGPRRAPR
jgi:transposase InsO family protein